MGRAQDSAQEIWAAFSPDGKRVVTGSRDGTARVWDAQTGEPLTEKMEHAMPVECAEFSPDGRFVATASSDSTMRLWDAESGQPLSEPFRHGDKVFTAHFSPDGRRVLTASRDKTARLWDVGFAPSKCPDWLLQVAEALAGKRLNPHGLLEPTGLDRAQTIRQIRDYLNTQPEDANDVRWGRWLLADRATRTISPFSSLTVPQYIQNRISEGTAAALEEAEQLAAGNPELLRQVKEKKRAARQ